MIRNMHAYLNEGRTKDGLAPIYYKMAAINPRNPVNKADERERELILAFNADKKKKSHREIIEIDGEMYLYVAIPFLANSQACLKCHGVRQDAPEQLQARYQGMGGFGETLGSIRAVESIRTPLKGNLAKAHIAFIAILAIGLSLGTMLLVNRHLTLTVRTRTRTLEKEMTDRKQAEEALRTSQEQLLNQQRHETERVQMDLDKVRSQLVNQTRLATIGQVAGSIAHELRNPLGAARNACYFLKHYVSRSDPESVKNIAIIEEEIDTASRIITELMDTVRAKPPVRKPTDVGQLIREAGEKARLADDIRCQVTLAPAPFIVEADPGQLRQVLANLLLNAAHALDGEGEIHIEASRNADCSEIVIRDNGPGIAAEARDRLFEPLFTTRAKGAGLGLTICREIIERHGGTIELVDDGQPGAAFRIRLPQEVTLPEGTTGEQDHGDGNRR